jgi:hypothetical protein
MVFSKSTDAECTAAAAVGATDVDCGDNGVNNGDA